MGGLTTANRRKSRIFAENGAKISASSSKHETAGLNESDNFGNTKLKSQTLTTVQNACQDVKQLSKILGHPIHF